MTRRHLVFLVEEPSMEAFLRTLLPRRLPADCGFEIHPFQGKADLLDKLPARMRGYSGWLPKEWRIVVIVDRDDEAENRSPSFSTFLSAMTEAVQ